MDFDDDLLDDLMGMVQTVHPTSHKSVWSRFIRSLHTMINDTANHHLIRFSDDGKSVEIHNEQDFTAELLPKYYKHSSMSSFIRQLNNYGFRTTQTNLDRRILTVYSHSLFVRGNDHLIGLMTRNKSPTCKKRLNNSNEQIKYMALEIGNLKDENKRLRMAIEKYDPNWV